MKKVLLTVMMALGMFTLVNAQNSVNPFIFNTQKDADVMFKVLMTELNLTGEQSQPVLELLQGSYQSQNSTRNSEMGKKDQGYLSVAMDRQKMHIEGNLKNILTKEQYQKFEAVEPQLAAKAKELMKGKN
jgi:hypothetical protein